MWQPAWRRAACGLLAGAPPLLLAALARASGVRLGDAVSVAEGLSPGRGFLLAAGVGLLLMPCGTDDLAVSSQRELARWQALAVCGGALCGLYAAAAAVCVAHGPHAGAGAWCATVSLAACVGVAPLFFRIPWRAVAACALIAAAFLLRSGSGRALL